jgi:hypothetical protein
MKIFVDLIHPANIHYFKYFIKTMQEKKHAIIIAARDKDVLHKLLNAYSLPYLNTGKGTIGRGSLGKALYLLKSAIKFFFIFLKQKPDIVLSFGSTPCAMSSFILRIPHIAFEDTEHAKLNRKLYTPFTTLIFTPKCFYEDMGVKHYRFNAYMELFYLHSKRFSPDPKILEELNVKSDERYIFMRFVSWGAFHDIGQKGISDEDKIKLISILEKYAKIFISSESDLPICLKKYEIKVSPEKIHNVLNYAFMYIGEGGTMASECAMLGVPSIYINSLPLMGYLKDAQNAGLLFHLKSFDEVKNKAIEIITEERNFKAIRDEFLSDKIDPTSFLVWLIENYPNSKEILRSDPNYISNFI